MVKTRSRRRQEEEVEEEDGGEGAEVIELKEEKVKDKVKDKPKMNKRTTSIVRKKKKSGNVNGTLFAYFNKVTNPSRPSSSSSEENNNGETESPGSGSRNGVEENERKKRKMDSKKVVNPVTRAFLDSGVPDVVVRAQKVVDKKRIEDEYLNKVDFFPKITLTAVDSESDCMDIDALRFKMKEKELVEQDDDHLSISEYKDYSVLVPWMKKIESRQNVENRHHICCRHAKDVSVSNDQLQLTKTSEPLPWIEEFKIESLKKLCCDKEAITKLADWLKQWKSDIKDDGGTSRKSEPARRRGSDDDDFITSDEEEGELFKKSVMLIGPPGCGKTAAVYAAAKQYGFAVVEVNFSSKRPGKEVIQRVEEAVLSHRLKSGQNCLLLFEDIDLVDPKEDEGFHSSVAQLITNAIRPIVMTTSCSSALLLDPKLGKKDPLCIYFDYPKPYDLVVKVLLPLIRHRYPASELPPDLTQTLATLLGTICRHGRSDIRQIINQTQFLFTFSSPSNSLSCQMTHQHSIQSNLLLDLGFIRPTEPNSCQGEDGDENDVCFTMKARKAQCIRKLDSISQMLNFLCDLDISNSLSPFDRRNLFNDEDQVPLSIKALKSDYFDPNFCTVFAHSSTFIDPQLSQSLVIESDSDIEKYAKGQRVYDQVGDYCFGWECASFVRTIIKQNVLDSKRIAKRNGRVTSYFNRLDRVFTSRVCETFEFDKELKELSFEL